MNNVLIKRIKALFLVAMAIAVALNLILTPVYHDGSPDYPVWEIMNWFMAAAVLVALIANIMRKRSLKKETTGALDYLRASITYYGAIALTMLFFWEWFWILNPNSETGVAITSHVIYFPLVDTLFTIVALATGCHLWNDGGE